MTTELFSHGYLDDDRLDRLFADRARLPRPLAKLHELQSGLPDPREAAPARTPLGVLRRDLAALAGFTTLAGLGAVAAVAAPPLLTVPVAVVTAYAALGVVGRLRRLVVGHTHEAGHGMVAAFYRETGLPDQAAERLNQTVLDAGSLLTLTRNGEDYRRAHEAHHDEDKLGTRRDPDGADLDGWGLWPDRSRWPLGVELIATALDPVWHVGFLLSRLRSNFVEGGRSRRVKAAAVLALLVGASQVLPFAAWMSAIALPWTVGYHWAALLQVVTEHPYGFEEGAKTLREHAARNWERVPMEPFPDRDPRGRVPWGAWIGWAARLAFVHVPSRLAVLDGTMIAHGWHHLAWPVGAPFHDWWETPRRMLVARHEGTLPRDAETPVVAGLLGALRRQAARYRRVE